MLSAAGRVQWDVKKLGPGSRLPFQNMDHSELLRPTVTNRTGPSPFNSRSLIWPAFFGGVAALAWVAIVNLKRLPEMRRVSATTWISLAIGAIATLAALLLGPESLFPTASRARLILRLIAVATAIPVMSAHGAAERIAMQIHGEHAPMWKTGLAAVLIGGTAQGLATAAILVQRGFLP